MISRIPNVRGIFAGAVKVTCMISDVQGSGGGCGAGLSLPFFLVSGCQEAQSSPSLAGLVFKCH